MTDDEQLLRQYIDERSESAFGELVARYIDLVYSVALRVVNGDTHLAQDVTQTVFIDLAGGARRLPRSIVLAGWLHRHTWFTAATAVRTERRRRTREQMAIEMTAPDDNTQSTWEAVAPCLDEALNQLNQSDRDALVLRFLKRQDLRAVGTALGVSEDSAQKRVSRALDKLRGILSQRGVALTAAGLAAALTAQTTSAAPTGLAVAVTAASINAAKSTTTFTLLKLMASTKLNTAIFGAIVLAAATMPVVIQQQAHARLRDQNDALQTQANRLAALQSENYRLSNALARGDIARAPSTEPLNEILRLRGEVGRLQAAIQELNGPKTNEPLSREEVLASMRQLYVDRIDRLKQLFAADPTQMVPEFQYLTERDWVEAVTYDHHRIDPDSSHGMSSVRAKAQIHFATSELSDALRQYGKEHDGQFPGELAQLTPYFKKSVDPAVLQNWVIVPTASLPDQMRLEEDRVITQKAPINPAGDQRIVVGLKGIQLGHANSNDWFQP